MTLASRQRLAAEALGTALLLAVVIGSGIMGERLAGGNASITLLANTFATVGGLYVLIEVFGPISGAHFNPAVTLAMAGRGDLPWLLVPGYVVAQLVGAWLAHAMFDVSLLQFSTARCATRRARRQARSADQAVRVTRAKLRLPTCST